VSGGLFGWGEFLDGLTGYEVRCCALSQMCQNTIDFLMEFWHTSHIQKRCTKYAFPFTGYRPSTFPQGQFLFSFFKEGEIWCFLRFAPKTIFDKN
jgi:hypothetical protein